VLGDVIVSPTGDVFTTDSASPALYRLRANGRALEPIAAGEPFVSLQGLALSADGQRLFVALREGHLRGGARSRAYASSTPAHGRSSGSTACIARASP